MNRLSIATVAQAELPDNRHVRLGKCFDSTDRCGDFGGAIEIIDQAQRIQVSRRVDAWKSPAEQNADGLVRVENVTN